MVAAFDALPCPAAVVDHEGVVVVANRRWLAAVTRHDHVAVPVGDSLRDRMGAAAAAGSVDAATIFAGLVSVLAHGADGFTAETRPAGGSRSAWFQVDLAPLPGGGAVVMLVDVTSRKRLEARLAHLVGHDAVTGALTRTALEVRVGEWLASGRRVVVLYADLDRFKEVNDTHGHRLGDELLAQVASRLTHAVRDGDLVARVGGDEFVVAGVDQEAGSGAADALRRRIVESLSRPFDVQGRIVSIGVSVGTAIAEPGGDLGEALSRADAAMYRDKR